MDSEKLRKTSNLATAVLPKMCLDFSFGCPYNAPTMQLPLPRLITLFALLIVLSGGAYAVVKEREVVIEPQSESRREPSQPVEDVIYVEQDTFCCDTRRIVYRIDPVNLELLQEIETVMSTDPIPDGASLIYTQDKKEGGDEIRVRNYDSDEEQILYAAPKNASIIELEYRKGTRYLVFAQRPIQSDEISVFALDRRGGSPISIKTMKGNFAQFSQAKEPPYLLMDESVCDYPEGCDGMSQPASRTLTYQFHPNTLELQSIESNVDAQPWLHGWNIEYKDGISTLSRGEDRLVVNYKVGEIVVNQNKTSLLIVPLPFLGRLEVYDSKTLEKVYEAPEKELSDSYRAFFLDETTLAVQNAKPLCAAEHCNDILIIDLEKNTSQRIPHTEMGMFLENR